MPIYFETVLLGSSGYLQTPSSAPITKAAVAITRDSIAVSVGLFCSELRMTVLIAGDSLVPVTVVCKQPIVEQENLQIIGHLLLRAATLHPVLWAC